MPLSVYFPPQYIRAASTSIHDILVGVTLRQFIRVSDHFVHDLCGASWYDFAAQSRPRINTLRVVGPRGHLQTAAILPIHPIERP